MSFTFRCPQVEDTQSLAAAIGRAARGGEVFTFYSDLGGGKTAFVKGLARGMGVAGVVQSPTFTLSSVHQAKRGLELHHFDFYRLSEAGIMAAELAESLAQPNAVVAVEWGDIVHDVLPKHPISITLTVPQGETRQITIDCPAQHIVRALQSYQQNEPKT